MNKYEIKRILSIVLTVAIPVILIILWLSSETGKRELKSLRSNYTSGLERTITLYDYNGDIIDSWSGKFDVSESEYEVYFDDEDSKRVIIHGGIVVNEELK